MNYPEEFPLLNLDFANGGDQLDSRVSFSRADSTPSAVHYRSNEQHLSSENLLQYSNPITSHWTETNTAITVNSTAAPDGTTTASKVLETSATGYHETRETFNCTNGVSHTATFYAKANGRTVIRFLPRTSSGVIAIVEFTLSSSGSESLISGAATRSIAAVGPADGWYKMTVTFTGNATATGEFQINLCESAGTDSYSGDAVKGVYLWGCGVSSLGEQILNPTSGQIHREYSSTLKSVANAGDPRFEYDPITRNADGLLIEQQFTQYAHYSEQFDNNGGWAKVNATVQPNSAVAPDGTLSADLIVESEHTGDYSHYVQQNTLSSVAVGKTFTLSVFAKAAGRSYLAIYTSVGGANVMGYFSLTDGSVTSSSGTASISSSDCGNGWYRLQMTFTTVSTSTGGNFIYTASDGSTATYAGNGYGSVLLWGANLTETGSSMSYVKAEASTETKSADSCSVALSDIGIASGQDLTAIVKGDAAAIDGAALLGFGDGTSSNFARVFRNSSGSNFIFDVRSNAVPQAEITLGSSSSATKLAFRLAENNIGASAGGSPVSTDTSATLGLTPTLQVGYAHWAAPANGTISRVALYNVALSDTELQSLTS